MRYKPQSSYKPRECPGCHVMQPLAADSICRTCSDKLEYYNRFKPQIDQLAARETTRVSIGERVYVPKAATYVAQTSADFGNDDHESGLPSAVHFVTAFTRLLMELVPHSPATKDTWGVFHPGGESGSRYLNHKRDYRKAKHTLDLTKAAYDAICDVYGAINGMIEDARLEGKEKGQNLLGQLAAGTLTVGDFEEGLDDIARFQKQSRETFDDRTARLKKRPLGSGE